MYRCVNEAMKAPRVSPEDDFTVELQFWNIHVGDNSKATEY